ncbi:MAG: aminotransferase class V-fold PLP-dependent enzyme, partial [Oscillospiraceae bacterium]|nr:aminotransferase class V-fold PLP-dependent enzyme [Oscillospiraceae bacterium]
PYSLFQLNALREQHNEQKADDKSNGDHCRTVPLLNISLPGYRSEVLMNYLDAAGIAVSRSSACKRGARSHVLEAMGLPASVMDGAIRLSFSRYSTEEEAEYFAEKLAEAAASLRTARR